MGNEDSFDSFDLKLRKRELVANEQQHQSKKQRDQESSNKVTSDLSKHRSPHKSKPRTNSLSENSDFIMPELEPQVTNISKNLIEKQMDPPKSHQKYKSRKEE